MSWSGPHPRFAGRAQERRPPQADRTGPRNMHVSYASVLRHLIYYSIISSYHSPFHQTTVIIYDAPTVRHRAARCIHKHITPLVLRLYSWVWFEPTMGTPLAPLRGLRPDFFRWPCCSRPSALCTVFVWLVRTKWCPRNARGRGGIGRLTRSQFWPKSHRTPRFGALPNDSCHDTLLGAVRRGGYAAFAPANATFLFLATGRRPCQNYRFITYTFCLLSI